MRKNIKNYTSTQTVNKTAGEIQEILARAGAKRVMFEYGDDGVLVGLAFFIKTSRGEIPVKLPARHEKVAKIMFGIEWQYLSDRDQEQAKKTAWKNIQDWIDAQLALIETEMVKIEEVFLPYMTDNQGKTFFESMEDKGFLLSSGGNN